MLHLSWKSFALHVHSRAPVRLLLVFAVTFFALQLAWEQCRDSVVETWVIDGATVRPAVWLINHFWPEQNVIAQENSLVAAHRRLNVLNGCEGLETLFLLTAAFLAYPFRWKGRLAGIGLSILLIYFANQSRIVFLWWAMRRDPALFGLLHGTVLPLILIAIALVFFMAFLPKQQNE